MLVPSVVPSVTSTSTSGLLVPWEVTMRGMDLPLAKICPSEADTI